MTRLVATVVVVLFLVATVGGATWAFGVPTQIEQRTTLATFERESSFSYKAMVVPGSVLGQMALAKSLDEMSPVSRADVHYTALLDVMNVEYSYGISGDKPITQAEEDFKLSLVVAAPGEWQKEIEVVPSTHFNGPFRTSARLNLGQAVDLIHSVANRRRWRPGDSSELPGGSGQDRHRRGTASAAAPG